MRDNWTNLIINKSAVKRIFFIYIPSLVALVACLIAAAFLLTEKPSPPLNLAQTFEGKIPIVYSDYYNIEFFGLEKAHPFDGAKYRRIVKFLTEAKAIDRKQLIDAAPPNDALLQLAHSKEYLKSLTSPMTMAYITEMYFLQNVPARLVNNVVLAPMKFQMGGSLLGAAAALKRGWAINLGGGFHHASYGNGMGFCALADISLVIKYLRREKQAKKFIIVDLDAHQGNGYERDFKTDKDVYIMDVYNGAIFPHDVEAKEGIDLKVELEPNTRDAEYLQKVALALDKAFREFKPDLVIYNAGTDILDGDNLGDLSISREGVIKRDELVFKKTREEKAPVLMLLSGGYQASNAEVIASSIMNLKKQFGLF